MPIYLDGFDGIFNVPLYELVSGFDLGVFPSYYEPWGYTPMESLIMGVPAVTSTLAGFGRALDEQPMIGSKGVYILDRENEPEDESLKHLTHFLSHSLGENPRKWLDRRIAAYQIIQSFSWKQLFRKYIQAYSPKK